MLKKVSYTSRITLVTIAFTFLIVIVCTILYSIYSIDYNQKLGYSNQTKTIEVGISQTSEANAFATKEMVASITREMQLTNSKSTELALEYIYQTQTAKPTITPTFTNTPSPTQTITASSTPSFTPLPEISLCSGQVLNQKDIKVYIYPGQSMIDENIKLAAHEKINVIGRIQDGPWIKVNINGEERWMLSSTVEINPTCTTNVFDLSFLLGEADINRYVLIDDTFATNKYNWIDLDGTSVFPATDNYGNDQIIIDTYLDEIVYSKDTSMDNTEEFHLITSFARYGYNKEKALVGVKLGINGSNPYSVNLTSTCQLRVIANEEVVFKKNLDLSVCSSVHNYWIIDKSENGELTIQLNSADLITVLLPIENQDIDGNVGFEVSSSKVYFDYIVITTMK